MYWPGSSTTMPEPFSALLITMVWSDDSSLRALSCFGVRLGVNFSVFTFVLTLFRYFCTPKEAIRCVRVIFFLRGCGSMCGLFLKKDLFLSKLLRDSSSGVCGSVLLGTKFRPKARTSTCVGFSDNFVTY